MHSISQRIKDLILLLVSFASFSQASAASLAEMSYTLLNGECPKEQNPPASSKKSDLNCMISALAPKVMRALRKDFGDVSENAYLSALAEERGQALSCSQSQITNLMKSPQDQEMFAADLSEKLIALIKEKKKMDELRPALGYTSGDQNPKGPPKPGSPQDEYRKARARAEAILSYLPYTQTPAMQKLIAHVSSQTDYVNNGKVDPEIEKSIQDTIKKTLPIVRKEIGENIRSLDLAVSSAGASMDDSLRESLAQDTELVESFHQKNLKLEADLKPIACRVDSKYGKGAQYRDNTFLVVTVLGTAVSAGVPALAVRFGMSAETAGAMASGRSFGILRTSSWAIDTALTVKQIKRACFSDLSDVGGKIGSMENRCETNVLTSLANDNCALATVVNALGAPGLFQNSMLAAKAAKSATTKVRYLETQAGRLREDKNHFAIFQDLMQNGEVSKAQKQEKELQKILSTSDMEVVKDIGGTSKGGGKFVKFSDGTLGVWKPKKMKSPPFKGIEVSSSEIAAYKLDRYLGLNQVPTVVERQLDGEDGVVSVMVGGLKRKPLKDDPEEILLFDYLIANADRHDENYLLSKTGKIVAIDHGLALKRQAEPGSFKEVIDSIVAFSEQQPNYAAARFIRKEKIKNPDQVIPKEALNEVLRQETAHSRAMVVQEISAIVGRKESYLKLKEASDDDIRKLLSKQLQPNQIDQLLTRRKEIVDAVEYARSRLGDQIFRAGPASPVREIHNDLAD